MRLLLDTHVLIWWLGGDPLPTRVTDEIVAPRNTVFASAASVWEAEIKAAAGKLELTGDLLADVERSHLQELAVRSDHGVEAARLPPHHGDPFDRMLIAQARIEGLTVVTRDAAFTAYDVPVLPA